MTDNKYWLYLENLRRSGETNMYGAAPYLVKEFGISHEEASDILCDWMRNYNREDYKPELLRVCYKRPGELAQVREVNNSLDALQHLVGGFIEVSPNPWSMGVGMLCNEEALLLDLKYNCMGLWGPVIWLGFAGEDFRSLTDEEVAEIMQVYGE